MTTHKISPGAAAAAGEPAADRWHGRSPALLDAVWDGSDDALLGIDDQGLVTMANRSAARIFGRSAEDLAGRAVVGLFPAHVAALVEALVTRVLSGEPVFHY